MMTKNELFNMEIKKPSREIFELTKRKWDSLAKPIDGLGDFEDCICRIFSILNVTEIKSLKKAAVVMCADNGIVAEGVTQCGQENTLLVARLLGENRSTLSKLADYAKADCVTVDVGINRNLEGAGHDATEELNIPGVLNRRVCNGTKNFLREPAMTEDETIAAIAVGVQLAEKLKAEGYDMVAAGEMGIGNTTTSTAVFCALTGTSSEEIVGRGAGLDDAGLLRKKDVIRRGLLTYGFNGTDVTGSRDEVLRALESVGGLDIASMAGLYIGCAVQGMVAVIDGFISALAAMIAELLLPGCREFMIASHRGRERGVAAALERLGLEPLINGNMALGEGTGAVMAMPLLDMALDFFNRAGTFSDNGIDSYHRNEDVGTGPCLMPEFAGKDAGTGPCPTPRTQGQAPVLLIIGTPSSGKSQRAEQAIREAAKDDENKPIAYIATMIPYGDEGKNRVARHRKMREGKGFITFETPTVTNELIQKLKSSNIRYGLLECVSNLIGNIMYAPENTDKTDEEIADETIRQIEKLKKALNYLVVVTNTFKEDLTTGENGDPIGNANETAPAYDAETRSYIKITDTVNARLKNMAQKYELKEGPDWKTYENY